MIKLTIKKQTLLIAVLMLVTGFLFGGVVAWQMTTGFLAKFYTNSWMLNKALDTQSYVTALIQLRDGKVEGATMLLESKLDEVIIPLGVNELYLSRTNAEVVKAINVAKDYRSKYPRSSGNSELDKLVNDGLREKSLTEKVDK